MKWYKKLYMGETAAKEKYKVFGRIRKNRFQIDTYLITIACGDDNLLEIINSNLLLQSFYMKESHTKDIYVVGIAKGYLEALELVRTIIDDVYTNTGGFDVSEYLNFGREIRNR